MLTWFNLVNITSTKNGFNLRVLINCNIIAQNMWNILLLIANEVWRTIFRKVPWSFFALNLILLELHLLQLRLINFRFVYFATKFCLKRWKFSWNVQKRPVSPSISNKQQYLSSVYINCWKNRCTVCEQLLLEVHCCHQINKNTSLSKVFTHDC